MKKWSWARLTLALASLGVTVGGLSALIALPAHAALDPFSNSPYSEGGCTLPKGTFFGFPTWYKYLGGEKVTPKGDNSKLSNCRPAVKHAADLWLIGAAIFEMLLYAAGVAAVGYVIWGALLYITSEGQPDRIANGKNTITNALVGLVLTILSARLVGFFAGRFSGKVNTQLLLPEVTAGKGVFTTILNIVFQVAGGIAVLMIIWGGITYSRSDGDPGRMKQAKETILYALIGLTVAIFAVAIINFVVKSIV